MQLLIQHSKDRLAENFVVFQLWAKFEVTPDEQGLIDTYGVRDALMVPALDVRAIKWAWRLRLLAGFFTFVIVGMYLTGGSTQLNILSFFFFILAILIGYGVGYGVFRFVYDKLRETILVRDLLYGHTFEANDVMSLVAKEEELKKNAFAFRHLLEVMKYWNEKHIVSIEPLAEPVLRMIEPPNAV